MDMQNVSSLVIPEGSVRTIHDKNSRLLWGKLSYDTQYEGDSSQQTYTGKNIINFATINYSAANSGSGTRNGATYTVTATSDNTFSGVQFTQTNLQLKPNTTYTFSATVQSTTNSNGSVVFITSAMSMAGSNINGNYAKAGERTAATFTTPSSIPNNASIRLYPRALDAIAVFTDIMVEENSAATNYEPYTGSSPTQIAPAPNPSYPQDVKVVTGEQAVAVTGKNLLLPYQFSGSLVANAMTFTMLSNGSILVNGTASANTWLEFCGGFKSPSSVKTSPLVALEQGVTYSFSSTVGAGSVNGSVLVYIQKDYPNSETSVQLGRSKQITDASGLYRAWLRIGSGTVFNNAIIQTQFELGASATAYEMPQSQNYLINLDSLELCKVGDYQDYIYKSGDGWYVHKAIGKISSYNGEAITTDYVSTTGALTNGATVYYRLATATDTQITDATLVGQLNAVHEWLTRYGYNATVTGNLPIIISKTNL